MKFGTLCSGIEGAAVALQPLGWNLRFSAEIDPYCCALLNHHYPGVPNYGDITKANDFSCVSCIVSGTPCQSYSVNGRRKGLADDRGSLAIRFVEIVREADPRWIIWENVPGVMSTNGGRDFGTFLTELAELGYGIAYRVLDARYFGVAQRRRRVFVVGHRGSWQHAAAVLFDHQSCRGTSEAAEEIRPRINAAGEVANGTLLGWSGDTTPKFGIEVTPTLRAFQGGEGVGVIGRGVFRKLTITEWERLQGFPEGYTELEGYGESVRRRAIGNAFCVPVIRWIGRRIGELDV